MAGRGDRNYAAPACEPARLHPHDLPALLSVLLLGKLGVLGWESFVCVSCFPSFPGFQNSRAKTAAAAPKGRPRQASQWMSVEREGGGGREHPRDPFPPPRFLN